MTQFSVTHVVLLSRCVNGGTLPTCEEITITPKDDEPTTTEISVSATSEPEKEACSSEGEVQRLDIVMDKGYVNISCVGAGACIHIHKVTLAAGRWWVSLLLR